MIVPMTKYGVVVYHREVEAFLERLQELGLVDVSTTEWEPSADELSLLADIEARRIAAAKLRAMSVNEEWREKSEKLDDKTAAEKVWLDYTEATRHLEELSNRRAAAVRAADDVRQWGEFDPKAIEQLREAGIEMHYFTTGTDFFAIATEQGETPAPPTGAQEVNAPAAPESHYLNEIADIDRAKEEWHATLQTASHNVDAFERHTAKMAENLDLHRIAASAERPAEGSLMVLEGWAERSTSEKVEQFLGESGTYYVKSLPTPEDTVPVALKNKKWSSPFELIGSFYSLPRYGSIDLTAFFGPFYMIFFGFCLGDAGYGLLFLAAGIFLAMQARRKGSTQLKQIATLTMLCGGAATIFGLLSGGFFGVALAELALFSGMRDYFLDPNRLFVLALGLGLVQIVFALILKVLNTTIQFGFRFALGTVGWILVMCAMVYAALPGMKVYMPAITAAYTVNMTAVGAVAGVGAVLMLFFHNPSKNPLANFGAGLWNTYNDVTGLLGDLLSYIRLFALCLSGGTLALVFNKLAFGMTADMPVGVAQLVAVIILLFGHGINLFMSALGSFVHPMRLTFVEFYKNAGFESAAREFKPLKKH